MLFYSWLELIVGEFSDEAKALVEAFRAEFQSTHRDEMRMMASCAIPQHALTNDTVKAYAASKYRVNLSRPVYADLVIWLEREDGGSSALIRQIISSRCHVEVAERGPINHDSFEAMYRHALNLAANDADMLEGISGTNSGPPNRQINGPLANLKLGPLAMEPEFREDVRAQLIEEDQREQRKEGLPTLSEMFETQIKREEADDVPERAQLPLPPPHARDVISEVARLRENRDRFRVDNTLGSKGGAAVNICLYTFFNTLGR